MIPLFDPSNDKQRLEATEKAMLFPVGAASPLWLMFAGAATAGMAFWWATRWRTATNLEAVLPAPDLAVEATPLGVEVAPPPVAELVAEVPVEPEPMIEAAAEPVAEAVDEAATVAEEILAALPEPVSDAVPVIEVAPEPVEPAAKPKAKPASAPKAAAARRSPRTTSGA